MRKIILLAALINTAIISYSQTKQYLSDLCIINAVNGFYKENTERVKIQIVDSEKIILKYIDTKDSYTRKIQYVNTKKQGLNSTTYYKVNDVEFDSLTVLFNLVEPFSVNGQTYHYLIHLSLYRGAKYPVYEAAYFANELIN